MMAFLGLVLVAFLCFALVFYVKQRQYQHPALRMPYQLRRSILYPEESEFLMLLQQAVSNDYVILCKIRLADVVTVTAIPRRTHWYQATNRLSAGCFDFLLCKPGTLEPVCAIEMEAANENNVFVDELCHTIGLPLVRLPREAADSYSQIRSSVERAIAG